MAIRTNLQIETNVKRVWSKCEANTKWWWQWTMQKRMKVEERTRVKIEWRENNSEGSEVKMKEMKREMQVRGFVSKMGKKGCPKKLWCDHMRQWKKLVDIPYKPWYSCVIAFMLHNYGIIVFFAQKKIVVNVDTCGISKFPKKNQLQGVKRILDKYLIS